MSADEFWKDDPQLFVSYRTSFINKKKREMEELDYKCWYQGLYNYDGYLKVTSYLQQFLHNMFSKNKNTNKLSEYPSKPYNEQLKENKEKQKVKEKQNSEKYNEFHNSLIYYGTMKQRYLENLKNKKGVNK